MNWKELIFSNEFKEYRKRQLQLIARRVSIQLDESIKGKENPAFFAGQMDMAARLLNLPAELIKDKKLQDNLNKLVQEDLSELTSYLLRLKLG